MGFAVALGILAWVAASPAYYAALHLRHPRVGEEIKPILSYLSHHGRTNDVLYVYGGAEPAFQYYLPFYRLDNFRVVQGPFNDHAQQHALNELNQLRGSGRTWVLFSHFDKSFFLEHLEKVGEPLDQMSVQGAWLGLYDL
jgi:hypothetical protein